MRPPRPRGSATGAAKVMPAVKARMAAAVEARILNVLFSSVGRFEKWKVVQKRRSRIEDWTRKIGEDNMQRYAEEKLSGCDTVILSYRWRRFYSLYTPASPHC
ncbi:hypothetical protein BU23DRAFT_304605 [Bimuria novae-zelandiae CBS 107.79]|uniref:Uncharacterized protein n=1 Tax=Bimuria novae-zelandiae CBS 107.79 TaxID=1447943 RepID=A0A6A5UST8_9PLEO|nr:hypothetical protein BU23DRAFT_304605 [Bimuria novae-zelandiae CBS 107.79]